MAILVNTDTMKATLFHTDTETEELVLTKEQTKELNQLVVWNDDVNTFDFVISTLMELCDHTMEQADQCALLIHMKGKCSVKRGEYKDLRPICEAMLDRGLSATID